jgi:hypothetical protein
VFAGPLEPGKEVTRDPWLANRQVAEDWRRDQKGQWVREARETYQLRRGESLTGAKCPADVSAEGLIDVLRGPVLERHASTTMGSSIRANMVVGIVEDEGTTADSRLEPGI